MSSTPDFSILSYSRADTAETDLFCFNNVKSVKKIIKERILLKVWYLSCLVGCFAEYYWWGYITYNVVCIPRMLSWQNATPGRLTHTRLLLQHSGLCKWYSTTNDGYFNIRIYFSNQHPVNKNIEYFQFLPLYNVVLCVLLCYFSNLLPEHFLPISPPLHGDGPSNV